MAADHESIKLTTQEIKVMVSPTWPLPPAPVSTSTSASRDAGGEGEGEKVGGCVRRVASKLLRCAARSEEHRAPGVQSADVDVCWARPLGKTLLLALHCQDVRV